MIPESGDLVKNFTDLSLLRKKEIRSHGRF